MKKGSRSALPLVVAALFAGAFGLTVTAACQEKTTNSVSVERIVSAPAAFRGERVVVSGRLTSVGANYFTDLRVVLTEPGSPEIFIHVRPWLPVELPPSPPGAKTARPPLLSDYLDHMVELIAVVGHGPLKPVGAVDYLAVESARLLDQEPEDE